MPRPRPNGNNNLPGTPPIWLPLGGKLSPQVTDEGQICGNRPFPQLGGVAPPYTAISPQSFLPHPYPINVRARRALPIYYLLSFIYYLFCPAGALSSPMVHRSTISREIATKKQPYVFRKAVPWCTIGDSNPGPTD